MALQSMLILFLVRDSRTLGVFRYQCGNFLETPHVVSDFGFHRGRNAYPQRFRWQYP